MKETHYERTPDEYRDALLKAREVEDFLPPPEFLIPKVDTQKVTISLSTKSIKFFKNVSEKTGAPYQQLIRKVLDSYADHHARTGTSE
jgi:predicted DNA binding CopG/RHH family protein